MGKQGPPVTVKDIFDIIQEEKSAVQDALGSLPVMPEGLTDKQQIFITVYYQELADLVKALRAAGVSVRTFYSWKKNNIFFRNALDDVIFLIKNTLQSIYLKSAIYRRDPRAFEKIMASFFPDVYGSDPVQQEDDSNERIKNAYARLQNKPSKKK